MQCLKQINPFQFSSTEDIESIKEKYELHDQLGEYMDMTKVLVNETAGTAGLNLANEQVKVFLTEFIPSIIINVTNIYGSMIGGKLLTEIQMTLASTLTGGFGFDSILDSVIKVVGLGSAAMLGFSEDTKAVKTMFSLLDAPFKAYATKLGYVSYIPKVVSLIPSDNKHLITVTEQVSTGLRLPLDIYKQVRGIYRTPFSLLSRWVADHSIEFIISEARDPYINNLIPAFQLFVDELLPKRDLESNFDPLMTQDEHVLDVTKKKINLCRAQYQAFKRNSNILIFFILAASERLLQMPEVQDCLAQSIAGERGMKILEGVRETYELVSEAYTFANDKHSLSKMIAHWMQDNFDILAKHASNANLSTMREHAELFKQAFSGKILTKSELDTIKGKWLITQVIEGGIAKAYKIAKDYVSEITNVESDREKYKNQIDDIKDAIELGQSARLKSMLNSPNANEQFSYRYILLKKQQLIFMSNGLPISPLLRAVQTGNYELVKVLVESCILKNFKNEEGAYLSIDLDQYSAGVTALQFAIMKGHNKIATYLISEGVDLVKPSIIGNATPLMIAARNGAHEVVDLLLSFPEVIEQIDSQGYRDRTALHYAMKNGHMDIAAKLIANCADLFLKDANGFTPIGLLYKQLEQENLTNAQLEQKFAKLLEKLQPIVGEKVHELVLKNKKYPVVKDYIHLAINIGCTLGTIPDKPWFNMLFDQNEFKLISKLMLDPNNSELIENEMWWAVNRQGDAVSILCKSMGKINANAITVKLIEFSSIKDIECCFFALTLESLSQAVINSIIKKGDFYQLKPIVLRKIFNHQIKNGQLDAVKLILHKSPKLLDLQDDLLNTPLHYALQTGRYEITQFLLDQGADITLKNIDNDTAYESWAKNNTFLRKLLKTLRLTNQDSNAPNDVLAKEFALNMIKIKEQIDHLDMELAHTPEKQQQQKIHESLLGLISQDSKDEVRNNVIAKILQKSYCDLDLFSINKGGTNSLILQAIIKKDYILLDVFIKALFDKDPDQREDVCQFFINELLSAPIAESELIKGLDIILKLPDNNDNALLLPDEHTLPAVIAFQNKKFVLMDYILNLAPQGVTLAMMDYILSKNLPCAKQGFEINQDLLVQYIKDEELENTVRYLKTVWSISPNDFNLKLFKAYFLNASGIALNQFLEEHKTAGYLRNCPLRMEQVVSKFDKNEEIVFINTKFQFLSDYRKLELLGLMIAKGKMDKIIRNIIKVNPNLLNLQLPDLGNKTLLHMAINHKNWSLSSYLLAKGSLVNLKNNDNNTAYDDWFQASTSSFLSHSPWENAKLEQIFQNGSDSERENALGRKMGSTIIVALYHSQEINKTITQNASQDEKIKIIVERIQLLLHAPNYRVLKGMNTKDYHQAIEGLITGMTIEYPITLDDIFSYKLPKLNGNTLLHFVISTRNKSAIDFILDYPVNLDLQNDAGNTPLHLAIQNGDFNLSKLLIEQGASSELENYDKKTANQLIEAASAQKNDSHYRFYKTVSLTTAEATDLMQLIAERKSKAIVEPCIDNTEVTESLKLNI